MPAGPPPTIATSTSRAPKLTSAQSARLATVYGDGWLAVGDAAQSFDPLSGEGLFHALFSGERAAQALFENFSGRVDALADYAGLSASLWERFLRQRAAAYSAETRWPDTPFWQRRLATATSPVQAAGPNASR